ncbi:hypothetical protein [Conexibacter arvalis]|uniref:Uncharacterized protein n=1 Tax=Conexibacter arvalis TaxID=912552 RepID=A0A840IH74_9ACTN|nr:hypothetical protein [Conexibacter arvalis]MBB4664129.1 hypothetical protein [Conexibacter arvalis]
MRKRMVGAMCVAMLVVGCGSSDDYANDPRPPRPQNVSVSVNDKRVHVSPAVIGAGPVTLTVANLSSRSRDVRLEAPAGTSSACVDTDTASGPINPQGTARLSVDLVEGDCLVTVTDRGRPRAATLTVGRERPSAQPDLLLP